MFTLLLSAALSVSAGPPASVAPLAVPRFKADTLPEGALVRLGGNRFTVLHQLQSVEFSGDGKELRAWDGHTLYRWEFPSGRPLGRAGLPREVSPNGHPFGYTALSPREARVAWIRFHDNKERLQVWDFDSKKLVLDCDATLDNADLDYAGLAWNDDATRLLAVINDKRLHVYDMEGKLAEKLKVQDAKGGGWELPGGKPWRGSGPAREGVVARIGKSRVRITSDYDKVGAERREKRNARDRRLGHVLIFTDLDTGKSVTPELDPLLEQPGHAAVSKDGRHLAIIDRAGLRIWDVAARREMDLGHAFPEMSQMVLSPGGAYLQYQRDPIWNLGTPWHSLTLESGRLRRLAEAIPSDGLTLGLGPMGFAASKDEFVGITGRSVDRWDLKTGKSLEGVRLPETPQIKGQAVGYDECILLGDGLKLAQFACMVVKDAGPKSEFNPTWRPWSPGAKEPALKMIPDCTWQRGAAALPGRRFLYFATPTESARAKLKEVAPGVTFIGRGETQMYFGEVDRADSYRLAGFSGTWSELRGTSRAGHLLLMAESSSTWIATSRGSQSTWADPAAQRHALLEYHSGEPVGDGKKLAGLIRDRASLLSADGRYLLAAAEGKLLLCEPYVLGKLVKEIALPATPKRFAASKDGTRIACQLDDATVMIWDGTRLGRLVDEALAREVPKDLYALAGELASSPKSAFRAARLLAAAGAPGVAALRKAITATPPDARQIAGWISGLDAEEPATRQKAEAALAGWGLPVEKALRAALEAGPSAEKRVRLRRLLSRFVSTPYGNQELAQARAVLSLDWNASPSAAKLLAEWAEKHPKTLLGAESRFALAQRAGR